MRLLLQCLFAVGVAGIVATAVVVLGIAILGVACEEDGGRR